MASVALALMVNGAAKAQTTALQHSRYTQDPVAAAKAIRAEMDAV